MKAWLGGGQATEVDSHTADFSSNLATAWDDGALADAETKLEGGRLLLIYHGGGGC